MALTEPAFWVEIGAAILGVWGVWDLGSGLRRGYLSGCVSTFAYVFLCVNGGIYADAVINAWYTIMGVVGWFAWHHRQKEAENRFVQTLSYKGLVLGLSLGVLAWLLFWFLLKNYSDSTVVLWDSTTSALAITAMFWMTAGFIWNWPLWLIINLFSVGLYLHKGMAPTAIQYMIFTGLAIRGWWIWARKSGSANARNLRNPVETL
jgi:nicotinamide mononucleotide transporter